MSREIVTSENREEYNNKKLGIKNEKDLPYYDEKGNIYHGKEIVGSLKLEKEPKYHRLSQININSKHQGKGIGSHIIKTVLKEAHEKNFPVTLTTGNYWVEFAVGTTLASNFTPPVTIVGLVSPPGARRRKSRAPPLR